MDDINVLIADDDVRIRKLLADFIKRNGFCAVETGDCVTALNILKNKDFHIDLAVLNISSTEYDGFKLLNEMRTISTLPILLTVEKKVGNEQLSGLKQGADDYIFKPFSTGMLFLKIKTLLKNAGKLHEDTNCIGMIKIDEPAHEIYVNNRSLELTPREYNLLLFFIHNNKLALSRERILSSVWDYNYNGDLRTVDTHIKQLRTKLGECADYIRTIRNIGYKFEVN